MAITPGSDILASDFINTSGGAGDVGKGVKLNGAGQLDITFIPTGTGPNQVVKLDGSSKLPAVDGSQLTNLLTNTFQVLHFFTSASSDYASQAATSETDGSVVWIASLASSNYEITRWVKDTVSGIYFKTHALQTTLSSSNSMGIALVGSFVYLLKVTGTTLTGITRFAKADLTGETNMTVAGTTTVGSSINSTWSDGTNIYTWVSGDTFRKWTLASTTWTGAGSTITYTNSSSITQPSSAISDGVSVWIGQSTTTGVINKYAIAGGSTTGNSITFVSPNLSALVIIKTGILGMLSAISVFNATVQIEVVDELKAITAP